LYGIRARAERLGGTCGMTDNLIGGKVCGSIFWFKVPLLSTNVDSVDRKIMTLKTQSSDLLAVEVLDAEEPKSIEMTNGKSSSVSNPLLTSYQSQSDTLDSSASSTDALLQEESKSSGLTAFVVDDVISIRKMLKQILLKCGFSNVDCYENGNKALEAMMKQETDVVFMDLQMPIMSGPEAVKRFREFESQNRFTHQMIVASSANLYAESDLLTQGFDAVLPKPINISEIRKFMKTHWKGHSFDENAHNNV